MNYIETLLNTNTATVLTFVSIVCIFVAVVICFVMVIAIKEKNDVGNENDKNAVPRKTQAVQNSTKTQMKNIQPLIPVGEILGMPMKEQNGVTINFAPKLTLSEAFYNLDWEQKSFFTRLRNYALSKPTAKESQTAQAIQIMGLNKPLIKLSVKGGKVLAKFKIENEFFRSFKKEIAKENNTKLNVKETPVLVVDAEAYATARGLIDITFESAKQDFSLKRGEMYTEKLLANSQNHIGLINGDKEAEFLLLAKEWESLSLQERRQKRFNENLIETPKFKNNKDKNLSDKKEIAVTF